MIEKNQKEYLEEKAILIGVISPQQPPELVKEYLDELEFLATTAGAITSKKFTQKLNAPIPSTHIGTGKANEIKTFIADHEISLAIFDDELSPSQVRNLEKIWNIRVIDRSGLILDIFAQRAKTAHAKTQVELAQYEYLLPRLAGMWTHLSRQKGGIGLRGPGETEIETDRRIVREKISRLKTKLEQIDKQKHTQRKNRGNLIRVALVGYTNVGKSTLLNLISKSDVFAENKLFATLDTTVRKVVIQNLPFLLSDTVGFIRKLPHQLVESFKSTLDETREADLLLHVVDISHQSFEDQMQTVNQTLLEIGSAEKPTLIVFNKIDQLPNIEENEFDFTGNQEVFNVKSFQKSWDQSKHPAVFISAAEKINYQMFLDVLYEKVKSIHIKRYPYNHFLY